MRAVIVACVHIHNMSQDTGFRSRSVLGLALCFPASMPLGQRYLGDTRPGCRDPRAVPPPSPVRPSPSRARLVVDFDDPVSLSIGDAQLGLCICTRPGRRWIQGWGERSVHQKVLLLRRVL